MLRYYGTDMATAYKCLARLLQSCHIAATWQRNCKHSQAIATISLQWQNSKFHVPLQLVGSKEVTWQRIYRLSSGGILLILCIDFVALMVYCIMTIQHAYKHDSSIRE